MSDTPRETSPETAQIDRMVQLLRERSDLKAEGNSTGLQSDIHGRLIGLEFEKRAKDRAQAGLLDDHALPMPVQGKSVTAAMRWVKVINVIIVCVLAYVGYLLLTKAFFA